MFPRVVYRPTQALSELAACTYADARRRPAGDRATRAFTAILVADTAVYRREVYNSGASTLPGATIIAINLDIYSPRFAASI